MEGSLITPVMVTGGSFGGNASLLVQPSVPDSGNLKNMDGAIRPGGDALYGMIFVGGDLEFSSTAGLFDAEVDSLANTDFIDVKGTAQLDGVLEVEAAVGNFLVGEVITIVNADRGRTGKFSTKIIPTQPNGGPLFEVQYTHNQVNLVVIADAIFQPGLTGQMIGKKNPSHVADYFVDLLPISPTSDLGFIVESLGLVPKDEINKVLNFFHPGSFGSYEWMNLTTNGKIMELFGNRMRGSQGSPSAEIASLEPSLTASTGEGPFYGNAPIRRGCDRDPNKRNSVWLQTFGTWNDQSERGELRGFQYETAGFLTGYDYTFDHWYVGAGIGYAYTNFRWQGSAGKGHIDQVYGGVYSGYFNKYFGVDVSTMVGGNFYHAKRYIRYSAPRHPGSRVNRTAHSDSSGIQWTNHLGLIGDFSSLSVPLQIFANLDHFYLHNNSFNETGANSINLSVNTKVSNALRSELGLSTSHTFRLANGCWTPYFAVSWVNKTLLSSSSYRSGFRGQQGTFSVSATSKGVNQWAPQAGIEFANKYGFSILLNSRAELNGKLKNYSADMQMNYDF
ncbi:autotransporter outer membrane beta-barrel domain-containing protein [Simkania sp.]|uniref:autotransporter outer membrane beta-barrel domain-containing protein n=1 Tax=Simkania sp. TaxID=34094 RepID=UPI003B520A48